MPNPDASPSDSRAKHAGPLYLIDASPYIFRAFYSLPSSMKDRDGRPANAARGFADFLGKLLADESPTHVLVAFDGSLTTSFRNDIFPAYKSSRELPDEALVAQLEACYRLADALGCFTCIDGRYEADDLVATARARFDDSFEAFAVVTADKDLTQLVDDRTSFYDFAKGARLGPAEVRAKFGVHPHQIRDLLGLAGDSVDDIPGVRGVGPKTATALLEHFENLEAIYEDLGRVKEVPLRGAKTLGAKLEEHRDLAFLSRELATCSLEAPLTATSPENLAWKGVKRPDLDALTEQLGYRAGTQRFAQLPDRPA
ncbi:DNA polymerase I [Planctomycetes bacterium Poly30]|uniref:DNA polymerase I n=1 Tax=Saltatorellus ferox TaxID=2528018 RepID=A0A518EZ41_9BACT|nr:DNA polymerase I [Planctomycetes bacterium Poly30]